MDDTGKMDEVDRQKINAFLTTKKEIPPTCEFCGTAKWNIAEHIVIPHFFGTRMPPVTYPQFMLACTNCGNTKYFSAVLVPGLLTPPQPATLSSLVSGGKNV
jgi:hypothetical protein